MMQQLMRLGIGVSFILFLPIWGLSQQTIKIDEYYNFVKLTKVLEDINGKYDVKIEYDKSLTDQHHVSILLDEVEVGVAMRLILKKTGLTFEYTDRGTYRVYNPAVQVAENGSVLGNEKYAGKATQKDITISGVIRDKESGEVLPFAQVLVKGTTIGATSNVDGYFTLFNVPSDTNTLMISYMGYQASTFFLSPDVVKKDLEIGLIATSIRLKEFQVVGEAEKMMRSSEGISKVSLTPKLIASLPNIGEKDIFRSFQLMPGISASNESSSGLYVRGGTPDQNLILYDGFTVYHVDHLFGMFSAFNSNAIKDVQLYKGGFESKYGGRISSVMDIVGKNGNEKKFNIGGDVSFLSVNGFTEIPLKDKGSIFLAARRSFKTFLYNNIFDQYSEDNSTGSEQQRTGRGGRAGGLSREEQEPTSYFYDLNAKFSYRLSEKDKISLSFFNGQDELDNSRENSRGGGSSSVVDLSRWGNLGSSFKYSRKWSDKFYTNSLISYSNYYSERESTRSRTITINDTTNSFKRGTVEDNDLKDLSLKIDNEWKLGAVQQLEFGLQLNNYQSDYEYILNDTIVIQERKTNESSFSFYAQDRFTLNKLTVLPGIRSTIYTGTNENYIEPRFSLEYKLSKRWKLKGAWGQYYQYMNRILREDVSSGSRDFWVLSDDEVVPVSSSEHFISGVSYELDNWLFDVEGFYKKMEGLSEYSLRFQPSFGNVDYDEFFYEGTGEAQGIEALLQRKFGKVTGWLGYTYSRVKYNFPIYGESDFSANHDTPHELKLVGMYKWRDWTFSATWIYATGKPYTKPVGVYELELPDGTLNYQYKIGEKNSERLPDYHRMDVAATRKFAFEKLGQGSISFSIFNFYNRKNIWYKEFEIDSGELIETDINLLGFTPNITLSFNLR